jgi:hypothetical protein
MSTGRPASGKPMRVQHALKDNPMYALRISFADENNNAFVELGGAAWKTRKPQLAYWQRIPAAAKHATSFLIDKLGPGDEIEDTKPILAETAEFLLGRPVTALIDRGRRKART